MTPPSTDDQTPPDPWSLLRAVRAAAESGILPEFGVPRLGVEDEPPHGPEAVSELLRILTAPHVASGIMLLSQSGLLDALLPEVAALRRMPRDAGRHKDVYVHTILVVERTPTDEVLRLAALLHDVGKPPTKIVVGGAVHFPGHAEVGAEMTRRRLRRLGADEELIGAVTLLVALHLRANSYEDDWTDSAVRRLERDAGDQIGRLLALSRADVTSARPLAVERALRRVDALERRIEHLRESAISFESPLSGTDLMAIFGRPPGRWIGAVKDRLSALVESGELAPDDVQAARVRAEEIVRAFDEQT